MKRSCSLFKNCLAIVLSIAMLIGFLPIQTAVAQEKFLAGINIHCVKDYSGATVMLNNFSTEDIEANLIFAVYESSGRLCYLEEYPLAVPAGASSASQRFDYNFAAHPDYTSKVFAINPQNYQPLCKPSQALNTLLFENGQWAPELGEIMVHTPGGASTVTTENGMICITNNGTDNASRNIPFRWVFENLVDMTGYDAVVMELDQAPVGWFRAIVRFRIDQDAACDSLTHTSRIRMAVGTNTVVSPGISIGFGSGSWDVERLRGVGALPNLGQSVKIKKVYLEGDGIISTPTRINYPQLRDIMPPRTGNKPVTSINTSSQYTATVEWSPNDAIFKPDTVYTATVNLTPRPGWTLNGVAANWFRIYNPTGTGSGATGTGYGTTHAAGSGIITKTFPATTPIVPYPNPTQFVALGFDDVIGKDTNALLDVLHEQNMKVTFFTIGSYLEKEARNPEYRRAMDRIIADGHEVGNHTWQHERWTNANVQMMRADFIKNQEFLRSFTGKEAKLIRFPYNDQNASIIAVAGELGLANQWGFDTNDWDRQNSASYIVNRILTQTNANNMCRGGQVYVDHDQEDWQNSTKVALPELAHHLRSRGIDFMTASDLAAYYNIVPNPGQTYNNYFPSSRITISTQPATITNVTEGSITGNLTVAATVNPSATPSYQWYAATFDGCAPIAGQTSSSFSIPTTLTEGTYYYYCVASAPNAAPVTSNVVTVNVKSGLPVLYENGHWSSRLGEITVHTPGGSSSWAYENGSIRITNGVPTSKNVAFRFVFQNLVDMRGYDSVVMELEEPPTGWFGGIVRFRIDQDACLAGTGLTDIIEMKAGESVNVGGMVGMSASNWDLERLRGVGGLPEFGTTVKIKKIYLSGDGIYDPVTINANAQNIMDIVPPRTGNTPVKTITTSSQYSGTVEWTPNDAVFKPDTEYTANITLTPKAGWKLEGVPANWFRIYNPTGTGSGATGTGYGTTHAADSGVITKTFPATTPIVPYPDPTQFVALSFDDVYLSDTEALVDALDRLGIKGTFFANGINLEKSSTHPDYLRALNKLIAGGHELSTHLWQHERYDNTADENVTRENFQRNQDLIFGYTGAYPRWSRIPYASQGTMSLRVAGEFNLTNLRGLATNDWDFPNSVSRLVNTVLTATGNNSVRDGQIYVCHNQPGQTNTVQAIPEYYHELRSKGVGFMTMSELRAHRNFNALAGTNYANFFQNSATPQVITISTQPTAPPAATLVQGNITGSMSVVATAAQSAQLSYQWYCTTSVTGGWTPVAGAASATLALPTDLTQGTYYFYCKLSASNAPSLTTKVVTVSVLAQ